MDDNLNIDELIYRYHEGELSGKELADFLRLVASDPAVRADAELEGELSDFLRDRDLLDFLDMLDNVNTRKRTGFGLNNLLLAALLLVMIALGSFWLFRNPIYRVHPMLHNPVAQQGAGQNSSSGGTVVFPHRNSPGYPIIPATLSERGEKKEKPEELLAVNFRPLAYLEEMVGVVSRAASFRLLQPECNISATPGDTLQYRWLRENRRELSFRVINNRGETMISHDDIPGASMDLPLTRWEEGLYYWKFIEGDQLVNVGKIMVRK